MTKQETKDIKKLNEEMAELRADMNRVLEILNTLSTLAKAIKWVSIVGASLVAIMSFRRL